MNVQHIEDWVYPSRIKRLRVYKGWTLKKAAEMMGYKSASTFKNLEDGKLEPKISQINRMAEIFGQPAHYLFKLNVKKKTKEGI